MPPKGRFAPRHDTRRLEYESGEPEPFRLSRGAHLPPRRVMDDEEALRVRAEAAHDASVQQRYLERGAQGQLLAPLPYAAMRHQAEQLAERRLAMQNQQAIAARQRQEESVRRFGAQPEDIRLRVPTDRELATLERVRGTHAAQMANLALVRQQQRNRDEREAEERDITNHIYDRARRDIIVEDYNDWIRGDGTGYRIHRIWTPPLFPVLEALDIRPFDEGAYHILRHTIDGMNPVERDMSRWPFNVMDDLMTSAQNDGPLFSDVFGCGDAPWAKEDNDYDDDVPATEAVSVVEEGTGEDVVPEGVAVVSDAVNETQA